MIAIYVCRAMFLGVHDLSGSSDEYQPGLDQCIERGSSI